MKEYVIYEQELPWWIYFLRPLDMMIISHYGVLCYGDKPPKIYWRFISHRYPELSD